MAHRKGVIPKWSQSFAYGIGLIVSDGNLSSNKRHITFTSKDKELILLFKKIFNFSTKIGITTSGLGKKCFRIQFSNVALYNYFESLGISSKKSLTIKEVKIPIEYFWDFLRGCIDGDGNIDVSHHPESRYVQLKVRLASGSKSFLEWILNIIRENSNISGGWITCQNNVYSLVFGKRDGIIILKNIYKNCGKCYLFRKKLMADQFLD